MKVTAAAKKKLEDKAIKMLEKYVKNCVKKFDYTKIMIEHPEGGESIWVTFPTAEDRLKHDRGQVPFKVIFANNALIGIPSWGKMVTIPSFDQYGRPSITARNAAAQIEMRNKFVSAQK